MKHQYFGDVNDYRKYGLLRALAEETRLPIAVFWMLTENDGSRDGEFRRYLADTRRWRAHDPDLYDRLRRLLTADAVRSVEHARAWSLLPEATYVDELVPPLDARAAWFANALTRIERPGIAFFDPDNGIEVKSMTRKRANKYVLWSELAAAFDRGHSLLVYQHYPRVAREAFHDAMTARLCERLRARTITIFATAQVAFFGVAQSAHEERFARAAARIADQWRGQIEVPAQAVAFSIEAF